MRVRPILLLAALPLVASSLTASAAPSYSGDPVAQGVGRDLVPVAHIAYKGGTDLEFVTIKKKDYAVAPAQGANGGLRMIDITKPEKPRVAGFLDCASSQNDVQVRGTLVLMGVDYSASGGSCYEKLGIDPAIGLMVIDIANPARPKPIGFVKIPDGVHNVTWHPGGRYAYVSDSELVPQTSEAPGAMGGRIQIVDLANPRQPKYVSTFGLPANVASSHDITFNKSGSRAYVAGISTTLILDSSTPAQPRIIATIADPTVNISHGADPTPDGKYLLVTDEQAGAAANGICNVGGVHVFDLTVEAAPVKVGFWALDPRDAAAGSVMRTVASRFPAVCTAHVLDYAPDGKSWSNADYVAGVRIVSAVSMVGRPTELAYFTPTDAVTWSAKTYKTPTYLFANDLARGFDVYKWVPGKGVVDTRLPNAPLQFEEAPESARAYCFQVAANAAAQS